MHVLPISTITTSVAATDERYNIGFCLMRSVRKGGYRPRLRTILTNDGANERDRTKGAKGTSKILALPCQRKVCLCAGSHRCAQKPIVVRSNSSLCAATFLCAQEH